MTLNSLSSVHIQKLGHDIDEIRQRALQSIYSKITLGLIDKDITDNLQELLQKLLDWFNYNTRSNDSLVLQLITELFNFSNISIAISEIGLDNVVRRIDNVERTLDPSLKPVLSQIKDKLLSVVKLERSTLEIEISPRKHVPPLDLTSIKVSSPLIDTFLYFPWQQLPKSDNDVLIATYEGLRYIDDVGSIQQTCHLFTDVILRDFPPEIFLQRPLIFRTLIELLITDDALIRLPVFTCFLELTKALQLRVEMFLDPCLRKGVCNNNFNERPQPLSHQINLPEYCDILLKKCVIFLSREITLEESNIIIPLALRLWHMSTKKNLDIFQDCLDYQKQFNLFNYYTLLGGLFSEAEEIPIWLKADATENIFMNPKLFYVYPKFHNLLLDKVKFPAEDYAETLNIFYSMEKAVNLLKTHEDFMIYMDLAYKSLAYHRNTEIFNEFIKYCIKSSSLDRDKVAKILVKYLSYPDENLKIDFYESLREVIAKFLGIEFCPDGSADKINIFFCTHLWDEILNVGLVSENDQLQSKSNEIMILVLKSQVLLTAKSWSILIDSLRPMFPILQSFSNQSTILGRIILQMFHPAAKHFLSSSDLLFGNFRLLFNKESSIRDEAFGRLCYFLTSDERDGNKLPKMSTIQGLNLSGLCVVSNPQCLNNNATVFYGPCKLTDSLSVLKNINSEPRLRRTALSHLSVVLKDHTLYRDLIKEHGVELLFDIMEKSLIENEHFNYPDSVIPIVQIIKNLFIYQYEEIKKFLSDKFLKNLLRSIFLFSADESFRTDAASLIFLITFQDQLNIVDHLGQKIILTSNIIPTRNLVPILLDVNKPQNPIKPTFLSNDKCQRLLRIYWASLWLGDFSIILGLETNDIDTYRKSSKLPNNLKLTREDVNDLQKVSVNFLRGKLMEIPFASSHEEVLLCLNHMQSFFNWLEMYISLPECNGNFILAEFSSNISILPWGDVFEKFLITSPGSLEDENLLSEIVLFLNNILRINPSEKFLNWLSTLVTNECSIFLELLHKGTECGFKGRQLQHRIIQLTENLVFMTANESKNPFSWLQYAKILLDHLQLNIGSKLYNIPHLDWLMSLLANITGAWKWDYSRHMNLYIGLITRAMEVLVAFYDFMDNSQSFMGLNIVNNCLLILVHLINDVPIFTKGWELIWQQALKSVPRQQDQNYSWLLSLWANRNDLIRASAISLIAGFFNSCNACEYLIEGLGLNLENIWGLGFKTLFDRNEPAVVREKCAELLTRLTALGARSASPDFLDFLSDVNFYEEIRLIIRSLNYENSGDSQVVISTKELVLSVGNFLFVVTCLNPSIVAQEIVKRGILHTLLSILQPICDIEDLYLNTIIAKILRTCLSVNEDALQIIKNSDKLPTAVSLLNTSGCNDDWEKLLTEIMELLSILLTKSPEILVPIINSKTSFSEFILHYLDNPKLLKPLLTLLNNLSSEEFSDIFNATTNGVSLGASICENFLHKELILVADTWSSILLICPSAQDLTLKYGIAETILLELRQITVLLNPYTLGDLKKASAKKKLEPILLKIDCLFRLLANLCVNNKTAQHCLANSGLADTVNKLWAWCNRPFAITTTLKLLCNFTYDSESACQSLALTATSKKSALGQTLLHALSQFVKSEMDVLSKTHDAVNLHLALQVLTNCCLAVEARAIFLKSQLIVSFNKFHPEIDRKKIFGDSVLHWWIHFLHVYSSFFEGQLAVCKSLDTIEILLLTSTECSKQQTRFLALSTLVHASMNSQNRIRLLGLPASFMQILFKVVDTAAEQSEVQLAGAFIWALAANSQKAKMHLRNIGCENVLIRAQRKYSNDPVIERALNVLKKSISYEDMEVVDRLVSTFAAVVNDRLDLVANSAAASVMIRENSFTSTVEL